jgi:hypothetical protein
MNDTRRFVVKSLEAAPVQVPGQHRVPSFSGRRMILKNRVFRANYPFKR